MKKRLCFDMGEFRARVARIQAILNGKSLDALLAFQPETVTWTTGFMTRGYTSFQLAIIPASGDPTIVCRDVEDYYVETTSAFPDRVMWSDSDDPTEVAARAIGDRLGTNPRIGIELNSWQLPAATYHALRSALPRARWQDESGTVTKLRLIKSPAEIDYQRRASKAAEAGMEAAIKVASIGVSEREMAAEICAAMIRAGSDLPGPGVLSSGERAHHLHGGYTDRKLVEGDIVQVETTPCVKHYHARFMRPIRVGNVSREDELVVRKLIEIQDAALAEVKPGIAASLADRIYRDGVLGSGLRSSFTNKTFYSVGLLLHPSGGEPLEAAPGCDWHFEAGMTFHTYVLAKGFGMSETIAVTSDGIERLTKFPRRLFSTGD